MSYKILPTNEFSKDFKKIDSLEAEIDAAIRTQFRPEQDELRIPLSTRLNVAEKFHLEQRYRKAGWNCPVIEQYDDPAKSSVLILDYDARDLSS